MALDELEEAGVLLPEEEWGEHKLETTVHQGPMLLASVVAVGSWIAAYVGGGNWLTWTGIVIFLVAFFAVIWMCDRAVTRQRKRFHRERPEHPAGDPLGEEE